MDCSEKELVFDASKLSETIGLYFSEWSHRTDFSSLQYIQTVYFILFVVSNSLSLSFLLASYTLYK